MAQVDITVNNQNFLIACEDGQEDRLLDLSKIVDDKVGELAAQVGQVGPTRLLVMAALVIADELVDLRENVKLTTGQNSDDKSESAVACINELSRRIEKIADLATQAL
jgi:cell division protein ZapA